MAIWDDQEVTHPMLPWRRVLAEIKARIESGAYPPGTELSARMLAGELGVSYDAHSLTAAVRVQVHIPVGRSRCCRSQQRDCLRHLRVLATST